MRNCSYCNLPGHDIRTCTDDSIRENIQEIEHTISHLNNEEEIKTYLKNRPLKILRVLCSPFGIKMSLNKSYYVKLLKRYYSSHANIQFRTNVTLESSETDIKEFCCNYIKHYLTFIVEQNLPPYSIIRFIENMNNDLWRCYRPEFSQSFDVFLGNVWMKCLFIMMDQTFTSQILNYPIIFNYITMLTMPFLQFEHELEPDWKMNINTVLVFPETDEVENEECPICLIAKNSIDIVITNCKHSFCNDCVTTSISMCKNARKPLSCALCRCNITTIDAKNLFVYNNLCTILE